MTTKKFWLVRDGLVGTAHKARDGRAVDFRPAEKSVRREDRDGGSVLVLSPTKGVEIEPIAMVASLAAREVVTDEVDSTLFRETWSASFEGVEFSYTREVREKKQTPEAEAGRAIEMTHETAKREAWLRKEAFVTEKMAALTAVDLIALAAPTPREWGRLGGAKWKSVVKNLLDRARKAFEKEEVPAEFLASGVSSRWWRYADRTEEETMRQELLQIWAGKKALRKAAFLSQ